MTRQRRFSRGPGSWEASEGWRPERMDSMSGKRCGGELEDDEVVAAEAVAEWGRRRGVRQVEEEAESAAMVQITNQSVFLEIGYCSSSSRRRPEPSGNEATNQAWWLAVGRYIIERFAMKSKCPGKICHLTMVT
jgi:hypothetical protein